MRHLQEALGKAGFTVKADGHFGPATVRAVKRFQRAARLTPSGVVGRKTVEALRRALRGGSANASGGYDPARAEEQRRSLGDRIPLRRGMSGHDVRVLQDFLNRAGLDVTIDGQFGTTTWRAVRAFERGHGLPVDGVVDAADIDALRSAGGQRLDLDVPAASAPAPAAPPPLAPGDQATIGPDGLAAAPASAPEPVKQIIAAGNAIAKMPYRYGGGHARWDDSGYDCSGSVSYALHGAGLLQSAMPSSGFMTWGEAGPGQWVTIYAHPGHMFMVVAGLRFDTSGRSRRGTRWQADMRPLDGYVARHLPGL